MNLTKEELAQCRRIHNNINFEPHAAVAPKQERDPEKETTEEYLARGEKITVIPSGMTAINYGQINVFSNVSINHDQ